MGFLTFLAPLLRLPRWVYAVVGVIAALGLLWALHGHWQRSAYNRAFNAGWAALAAKDAAAVKAAETLNAKAVAKADAERVTDTTNIKSNQDERNAAIDKAKPSATGDATRAANCVRWRNAHRGNTAIPAGC